MANSEDRLKMNRRSCIRLLGLTLAGGLLAACQQAPAAPAAGKPAADKSAAPEKAAAPAAKTAQLKGVTLRISTQNGPSTEAWKAILPGFESKYGAKVEVLEDAYNQVQAKQFAEAAAHTGAFDLIGLQTFDLGKYIVGGVLADLTPFFENSSLADPSYDLADFIPVLIEGYCKYDVEGKRGMYVVPHKFDVYMAIYRPDLFEAAGVAEPGDSFSYDDLIAAGEKLKAKQGDNPSIRTPLKAPGPAFTAWSAIYRSHGGDFFDQNKYPLFSGDAAITAVEKLRAQLKSMPADALNLDFDPSLRLMAGGRAAYAQNWHATYPTVLDPKESQVADKVKFMQSPGGPTKRAQELGGWTAGMSPDSKNKEAAFTLLQYLTSKETAVEYALAGGSSGRSSVASNPRIVEKFPYYPLTIEALKNAVPRPTDPTWGQTQGTIGTAVNASLQAGGDPKAEFLKAAESIYKLAQQMGFQPERTGPPPGN